MKRESSGPVLSTVFVDYDNIYLSLKRKNEDAAKRFAKDSAVWLQGIASGELITSTNSYSLPGERRIAMNRCYGNPVPRRNAHDNSTDMNSFPFIRHHFLRSGFEVIDCPPLTAQLKNSADIRIVMDVRDILNHDTYFDEFIILSGDADFTPLLHRLRAHARRTVVFANDHTAQPYTAISDGEIRESNLITLLTSGNRAISGESPREIAAPAPIDVEAARKAILSEVVEFVRVAPQAVPLETLADRAVRVVGRDKTVGTNWGGYGSFRDLLLADLPEDIHLSDTAPYTVFDGNRHISAAGLIAPQQLAPPVAEQRRPEPARAEPQQAALSAPARVAQPAAPAAIPQSAYQSPVPQSRYIDRVTPAAPPAPPMPTSRMPELTAVAPAAPQALTQSVGAQAPGAAALQPRRQPVAPPPQATYQPEPRRELARPQGQQTPPPPMSAPMSGTAMAAAPRGADQATQIQQSIARIHDACQAPALAPAEYRVLFDVMSQEITSNGLQGAQTLVNITQRAREFGLDIKRDDLRFIYDVVSESDPWFEQGTSASLFAGRFRNFVVARCRSQGLSLSADELDLIEAWFSAPQQQPARQQQQQAYNGRPAPGPSAPQQQAPASMPAVAPPAGERWWSIEEGRQHMAEQQREAEQRGANAYAQNQSESEDEFPRIVRSRFRG
ncbi:NYN domain-containing protein [Hyphomicrobium facile]|uniref:NYN domain-containing protein n=1 Tax=Hyphomicrobium facile TaxID=51670 RepID=A0A1I7NQB1_9HYPH|nr:NYN domain-containing protein [Hyphomicrobium facile]SFV36778.1 NYN domain-containing protein [Hyphomicrobium facile]